MLFLDFTGTLHAWLGWMAKVQFLPAVLAVKEAIDSGKLGKIRMAEFNHSFYGSYNNWMYDEAAGGGPLLSSAIYVIELMQFLLCHQKLLSFLP